MSAVIEPIETAIRDVQEMLKILVAQMKAKGYDDARASIEIKANGAPLLELQTGPHGSAHPAFGWGATGTAYSWQYFEAATLAEALTRAHQAISAMEEHPTLANAAWFDPLHPINQPEGDASPSPEAGADGTLPVPVPVGADPTGSEP